MKRFLVISVVALFGLAVFGCGKKTAEETTEPMSMETMSTVNVASPTPSEAKTPEVKAQSPAAEAVKTEAHIPVSAKPTPIEIQTALKNAGFYTGNIDGKIRPRTKKAIEDFHKANGLKVDGKVGPKTWELLKVHLVATSNSPEPIKNR